MSDLTPEEKKAVKNFTNIRDRLTVPTKESSLSPDWQWKLPKINMKDKTYTIQKAAPTAASKAQVTPSQESVSADISDVNSSKQSGRK